ncbi:glycosyl hydrolase [Lacisediminihabitans changchengi]|uniref:GH26 domain-containing protein n=1 Tax=Lacisediminihabitans changchengi TaxID=2787634 RepID=A0A934SJW7_9MICO|nr:glycosyl hydrolase [Lacisediminihabitans changchengi]MBK4346704.1 hypothetical protein [Lacisediminihabitans changchengi]MBK4348173.1 hypothetical protein [Lacisediminihabitans changchengi]
MSSTNRTLSWWAHSSTRARFTLAGAALIILALISTSVVVWNSPSNPIAKAVAAVSKEDIAQQKVLRERNALLSQVVALQKQLVAKQSNLSTTKNQLASIQQQLWSAQGKLDAAAAAAAGAAVAPVAPVKKPTVKTAKPAVVPAVVSAPSKAAIMAPTSPYFGLYTEQAPFSFSSYDAISDRIGSSPNVVGYFGGWDQTYRGDVVANSWKRNTLPILTWESRPINASNAVVDEPDYALPKIIGGNFDAYLHQYAKDIVATGLPLGIRLDHEMNGIWYPWAEDDGKGKSINGNNAGDYVKMWQHVHDIFQQEGANALVVWIWAPNIVNNLPTTHKTSAYLDGLYPGDQNVDVVGLSGYLRPAYKPDNNFTFDYTFGPTLKELRRVGHGKPILLAEIGASETGGHKPAWVTSLFSGLNNPANSDIIGFVWFDLAVTTYTEGQLGTNDWRIDSRPETLAAFIAGLNSPGSRFHLLPR